MTAAFAEADAVHMTHALALGRRGLGKTAPNPSVGCVLVKDGVVVGRGVTQPGGRPHGETVALAHAGAAARGATAYVTLEPCSHFGRTGPCVDALARAGVVRVVAAIGDPDPRVHGRGFTLLRSYGVRVETGLMEDEARLDHRGHFSRVTTGRPFVQLKLAVFQDGFVVGAARTPVKVTGPAADAQVHLMRAAADAIMVGVGTIIADDPALTCRLPGMADRSPRRIVVDPSLRTPLHARVVRDVGDVATTIIAAEDAPEEPERALRAAGVDTLRVARRAGGGLDLGDALRLLGGALGVTRLMVEGGPGLARSLLDAHLVDEVTLFRAAKALGGGLSAFDGPIPPAPFHLVSTDRVGPDARETYRQET